MLANRLTENPHINVLVLEAGVRYAIAFLLFYNYITTQKLSDVDVLPAIVPFLGPTLTPSTRFFVIELVIN